MNREQNAYFLNTYAENKTNDGYKLILHKRVSEIDDPRMGRILETISALQFNKVYVVGCGLGDILVNLKRLHPKTRVSGCEVSDVFFSFGNHHFHLDAEHVHFEIKEPPYHTLPPADIMVSVDYLTESPEGVQTFDMMFEQSNTVLVFDPYSVRKYLEANSKNKFISKEYEDYTIYERATQHPTSGASVGGEFITFGHLGTMISG